MSSKLNDSIGKGRWGDPADSLSMYTSNRISKKYDSNSIPDKDDLEKRLSEAGKLRSQFWNELAAVQHQIGLYLGLHKISEEVLKKALQQRPEPEREFILDEWNAANDIEEKTLNKLSQAVDFLAEVPELDFLMMQHAFNFKRCLNCGLIVPPGRRKYCSQNCNDQYRKKHDARRRRSAGIK